MALIRALTRPQLLQCPFARPSPACLVRGKKTKAAKAREAEQARLASEARKTQRAEAAAEQREGDDLGKNVQVMLENMKKDKNMAPFVGEIAKRFADLNDPNNSPDYDEDRLDPRLLDTLIANPAFADLKEDIEMIKSNFFMTKEEEDQAVEEAYREAQPEVDELNATMRTAIEKSLTMLINDPDVGDERADLQAVLDILPNVEDFEDPEFGALMDRAQERVNNNPKLHAKLEQVRKSQTPEELEQLEAFQKYLEDMTTPPSKEEEEDSLDDDDIEELMDEMREIMKTVSLGADDDKQLRKLLAEFAEDGEFLQPEQGEFDEDVKPGNESALAVVKPNEGEDGDEGRHITPEFAALYNKIVADPLLVKQLMDGAKSNEGEDADVDEHIHPELAAMAEKIAADPRLMKSLVYLDELIDKVPKRDPNDLTQIDADLAPDPYEMEDARTATLAQRIASARVDPEHSTAMRALRVKLQPPYNIAPSVKAFNQAIEFAYIGANDDVRRVLWRSYQRARTLPTFLQSLSDDAWDILYYSQAVTWTGNQNRTDHLKMLLKDLAATGRSGPPTHPSTLGQHQEAARLEAAQREQWEATRVEGEIVDAARVA